MSLSTDHDHDLTILEHIESDPDATQATLAAQLGVAIGTINWHIKRLIDKGYVKVRRVSRRKLRYIITPEGISHRAHLTVDYIQNSFRMFRLVRGRMAEAVNKVRSAGNQRLQLGGEVDGDVAEVCRLTCLEMGMQIVPDSGAPVVVIKGLKMFVSLGEEEADGATLGGGS